MLTNKIRKFEIFIIFVILGAILFWDHTIKPRGGVKNDFGKKIVAKVQKKKVITWSLYGIVEKDLDLK
jgi:hypothetical protein